MEPTSRGKVAPAKVHLLRPLRRREGGAGGQKCRRVGVLAPVHPALELRTASGKALAAAPSWPAPSPPLPSQQFHIPVAHRLALLIAELSEVFKCDDTGKGSLCLSSNDPRSSANTPWSALGLLRAP